MRAFLRTRRSIRRFTPEAVPDSVLTEILQTATFAPSAHNRQPWRFCITQESAAKTKLADEMSTEFRRELEAESTPEELIQKRVERSRGRILSAPVVVILCVDMSEMDVYPDPQRQDIEHIMAIQSAANAGLQLLLAAHAEGLGGVWIGSPLYTQKTIRNVLRLPETWEPQAMFLLGYPAESPEVRERKPLEKIARWNRTP